MAAAMRDALRDAPAREASLSAAEEKALVVIQAILRDQRTKRARPDLAVARAYADSFMPRDDASGKLYRTPMLTEPVDELVRKRAWRSGAPLSYAPFDSMGVNVATYMRLVEWSVPLYATCSAIALIPVIYNMTGSHMTVNQARSFGEYFC